MAKFGRFESIREISRMGYVTIHSGRMPGDSTGPFVIKVFQPPALLLEEEQARTEIDLFLKSADAQQTVAAGGAQHWAPIHEYGRTPEGAFYVTDKYEHALQQFIDVRLKLDGETLGIIVGAVAEGLIELKDSCGRPHGNLTAANVLIGGTGDVSERTIVLCDPLPDERIDATVHCDTDLLAVAALIYQLVVHRPPPNVANWEAPDSEEWHGLGKQASSWRNLCNQLFSAAAKPNTITLATLTEGLAELKKTRSKRPYRWFVAAGLTVIAAAIILGVLLKKPPPPELVQWEQLCLEYGNWAGALYEQGLGLNRKGGNQRAQRWRQDEGLREVLKEIEAAGYPYQVADDEGMTVEYIVDKPQLATASETTNGLAAIESIKTFFDPNSGQPWPLLLELNDDAKQFRERRWEQPATYLASLANSVVPEPNRPIAGNVDKILELSSAKGTLGKIRLFLRQIDEYQEIAGSSGDPILATYRTYADQCGVSGSDHAREEDLDELRRRLNQTTDLGRTLADFINGDWQTAVDQQAFFDDHRNDSAAELTEEVFETRLAGIKQYRYLRPDPRDDFVALVDRIENGIPLALVSNPVEADKCAKDFALLQPSIEAIREMRGIEKSRLDITEALAGNMPKLEEVEGRVAAATETARAYHERIKTVTAIATSPEVNAQWMRLRDNLLGKYPEQQLAQDLTEYAALRRKMEATQQNLVELDAELQAELPPQINVPLRETGWNNTVEQAYELQREQAVTRILQELTVLEDVPDVNGQGFTESKQTEFAAFKQLGRDLTGIVTAFNAIEDAFNACYLLDDPLPRAVQNLSTIRTVWAQWRDSEILESPAFSEAFAAPVAKIAELEQLDMETDRQILAAKALASAARPEVVYAAWTRLGSLSAPPWPNNNEAAGRDRNIRDILRRHFETTERTEERRDSLLTALITTGLEREIVSIERNSSGDKVLARFGTFAMEASHSYGLNDLENLERVSIALADYVSETDWQNNKIHKTLFFADSRVHREEGPVSLNTFENWLAEVKDYRQLDSDPRGSYSWETKRADINQLLSKGLEQKSGLTEENLAKLEQYGSSLAISADDINALRALPPIKKYEDQVGSDRCRDLWNTLEVLETQTRMVIKPTYCHRIELENGRVTFATDFLRPNFQPIAPNRRQPLELPDGWEQMRQAVNERQEEWLDFFFSVDANDIKNGGWPRYIRSVKDPDVVLRYVPTGPDNPEPFYMAIRETTNGQYRLFLEEADAKRSGPNLQGWSMFTDSNNNRLIQCTATDVPTCAIKWDGTGSTFTVAESDADLPVTWVTFPGAQAYATWLGGHVPTAAQHQYACRAGSDNLYPWGSDISAIPDYAHVRGVAWQEVAEEWNREKDRTVPPLPIAPIGAIEDYRQDRMLDTAAVVNDEQVYSSAWPASGAAQPNAWGLYDMIGNVWEWCRNDADGTLSQICGGSSLAPLRYVLLESSADYQIDFDRRDSDVGFRVIVPAR